MIKINNTNERLKELRKSLGLTLKEFGENMGISTGAYNEIEKGRNNLTDRNKKMLCQSLNINPEWLETGKGDKFITSNDNLIEKAAKEYDLDDFDKSIVRAYMELPKDKREVVKEFIKSILNGKDDTEFTTDTTPLASNGSNRQEPITNLNELSIDERVELYRRELEREQKKESLA